MFRDRPAREAWSPKNHRVRAPATPGLELATVRPVVAKPQPMLVARGWAPDWLRPWLRAVLVVAAGIYYFCLLRSPSHRWQPLAYFSECTKLFPEADTVALEYRLEGWSCAAGQWQPLDPRAYFSIEADDKESRLQRFGYFYVDPRAGARYDPRAQRVMMLNALDDYIVGKHPDVADGIPGNLGGIRFSKWARPLPAPGDPVARYVFRPLEAPPADQTTELFATVASKRKQRCGATP